MHGLSVACEPCESPEIQFDLHDFPSALSALSTRPNRNADLEHGISREYSGRQGATASRAAASGARESGHEDSAARSAREQGELSSHTRGFDNRCLVLIPIFPQQWQAVITESGTLQQALFLTPENAADGFESPPTHLNPLLTTVAAPYYHRYSDTNLEHLFTFSINPKSLPPHASAWRMYLCQPPQHLESLQTAIRRLVGHLRRYQGSAAYMSQRLADFYMETASRSTADDSPHDGFVLEEQFEPGLRWKVKVVNWTKAKWVFKG